MKPIYGGPKLTRFSPIFNSNNPNSNTHKNDNQNKKVENENVLANLDLENKRVSVDLKKLEE